MRDGREEVMFDLEVEVPCEPAVEEVGLAVGGVVSGSSHPVPLGEGLHCWAMGVVETLLKKKENEVNNMTFQI